MVAPPCCAVCGRLLTRKGEGHRVEFANYDPSWIPPDDDDDTGTSPRNKNSIGVWGPEGHGLFCSDHRKPAMQLRRLTLAEAVARLRESA